MVITTILITALITTLLYTYISREVFTRIKEDEMLTKARALGRILGSFRNGAVDEKSLLNILDSSDLDDSILDAYVVVGNAKGELMYVSHILRGEDSSTLQEAIGYILSGPEGNTIRTNQIRGLKSTNFVVIGTPVHEDGEIIGAVLMLAPLYESMAAAMSSLNGALLLSLLVSLPIVAVLVYHMIALIVRPLRHMRDVALRMAGGNFSARADDTQRGEIGQLGSSLNYLARALSRSISELTLERNRLRNTINGLNEGLVAQDAKGNITHINPALTRLFAPAGGVESDEKMELIPLKQVWDAFREVTSTGDKLTQMLTLPGLTLQMDITPLIDGIGDIVGAVGLFRDVTESERLERTRRDYVANVSHEMRTPLTAMRGLLEPLSEGMVQSEEARNRYYAILMRETLRLSRLIDDLMELSRLQSGTLVQDFQNVCVRELLEDLASKYAPTAEENGIGFFISGGADFCPDVFASADRIEQILVILLDNAIKYTPEGGEVSIETQWDDERVVLSVRDTGIGISPEDREHVFDRFYKVDKAHSGLGSGLGLSIAREMLRLMGEEIWLESEEGMGSRFSFTVKRAPNNQGAT